MPTDDGAWTLDDMKQLALSYLATHSVPDADSLSLYLIRAYQLGMRGERMRLISELQRKVEP